MAWQVYMKGKKAKRFTPAGTAKTKKKALQIAKGWKKKHGYQYRIKKRKSKGKKLIKG